MSITEEIWKPIWHAPGYEVSNLGNVRSLDRERVKNRHNKGKSPIIPGKVLKPWKRKVRNGNFYFTVTLCTNGRLKKFDVHRLVGQAFIPNPHNLPQINHKNNVGSDNRVENLEWVTSSQNRIHAYDIGAQPSGSKHPSCKLTHQQILEIKEILKTRSEGKRGKPSFRSIAKKYNVGEASVRLMFHGRLYKRI